MFLRHTAYPPPAASAGSNSLQLVKAARASAKTSHDQHHALSEIALAAANLELYTSLEPQMNQKKISVQDIAQANVNIEGAETLLHEKQAARALRNVSTGFPKPPVLLSARHIAAMGAQPLPTTSSQSTAGGVNVDALQTFIKVGIPDDPSNHIEEIATAFFQ